jgi:Domain of unknown function (DUF1772)
VDVAIDIAGFVAIIAAAVVAGGQLFCLVALLPALAGFTPEMSAIVHRDAMTDRPHHFLRVFALIMLVSGATLLVLMIVDDDAWLAIAFAAIGLASGFVSSLISSREWPINEEIKSWGDSPKVERYAVLRRTWDTRHVRRSVLSTLALAAFVAATLASEIA